MTTTRKKAEEAEMPTLNIWQKLHAAKQQIGKVSKNATESTLQKLVC